MRQGSFAMPAFLGAARHVGDSAKQTVAISTLSHVLSGAGMLSNFIQEWQLRGRMLSSQAFVSNLRWSFWQKQHRTCDASLSEYYLRPLLPWLHTAPDSEETSEAFVFANFHQTILGPTIITSKLTMDTSTRSATNCIHCPGFYAGGFLCLHEGPEPLTQGQQSNAWKIAREISTYPPSFLPYIPQTTPKKASRAVDEKHTRSPCVHSTLS